MIKMTITKKVANSLIGLGLTGMVAVAYTAEIKPRDPSPTVEEMIETEKRLEEELKEVRNNTNYNPAYYGILQSKYTRFISEPAIITERREYEEYLTSFDRTEKIKFMLGVISALTAGFGLSERILIKEREKRKVIN